MNNPTIPTGPPGEQARMSDTPPQGIRTEPLGGTPPAYSTASSSPETPISQPYTQAGAYPIAPPPVVAPDTRRSRSVPIVGPVILIGAGVVFLLNNLDLLPWSIWNQLWRLWPLILIAIGIDLLIGRRNSWLSLLLVLIVVGGGVAFVAYSGGLQPLGGLATSTLNIPLSGAKSAQVTLDLGTGNLTLDGGGGSEQLASGSLEYYQNHSAPEESVTLQGDKALLTLRQHDTGGIDFGHWIGSGRGPEWNVHLATGVPLSINADLGTGNSTLDLSSLKVTDVDVNSGTGNTTVIFPASAGQVSGTVDGGVGNLSLRIPDSVEARIDASSGIGNINIDGRFTKQGDHIYTTPGYDKATNKLDLKLDVGVGNVDVTQ